MPTPLQQQVEQNDAFLKQKRQEQDLVNFGTQANYPAPPKTVDQIVQSMPNSEKLTQLERDIYGALPGFAQGPIGKVLSTFAESPAGKALGVLDILAEGLERTVGLAAQLINKKPGEEIDIKSAWYAGGLTADVTNLPVFVYKDNPRKGQKNTAFASGVEPDQIFAGFRLPDDLPGTVDGLALARKKIARLIEGGTDPGEALAQTRAELYQGEGALALRSQLNDSYFHILGDPLNYILPQLKVVDRLNALGKTARSARVPLELVQEELAAAKLTKNTEKIAQLTEVLSKVESGELRAMSGYDKLAVFMTGGNPLEAAAFTKKVEKIPVIGKILKEFQLTPASKAQELVTMVPNHIGAYIVGPILKDQTLTEAQKIEAIVKTIGSAEQGALGERYGHALLTIEGRAVQGALGGAGTMARGLAGSYAELADERALMSIVGQIIGEEIEATRKLASEDATSLMNRLVKTLSQDGSAEAQAVLQEIQQGMITADRLADTAKILDGTALNPEMFGAKLLAAIEDTAARMAVVKFGVTEKSLYTKWADVIKAAETMAFIRLNPGNTVRNIINNEVTMIARGAFGMYTGEEIKGIAKSFDWLSARASQGFGLNSEVEGAGAIAEAVRGTTRLPDKIKKAIQGANLGVFDFAKYSAQAEQAASLRASVAGVLEFIQDNWKPGVGFDKMDKVLDAATMDAIRLTDPNLPDALHGAIQASMAQEGKLALETNLNMNWRSVFDNASETLGYRVEDALDPETLHFIQNGWADTVKTGKTEQFIYSAKAKIKADLNFKFEQTLQELPGIVKNQVIAGGPKEWYRHLGNMADMWWHGETEHAMRIAPAMDAARAAQSSGDFKAANSLYRKVAADEAEHFAHYEARMNAVYDGMAQAWRELKGLPPITEVKASFGEIRKGWRDFFEYRNKTLGDFFDAKLEGKKYRLEFDAIQEELNTRYAKMIDLEDAAMQRADDAVAMGIPDPQARSVFMSYRDKSAALRRRARELQLEFRAQLSNMDPAERGPAWQTYWQERYQSLIAEWQAERAGLSAMQGNPEAAKLFEPNEIQTLAARTEQIAETVPGPAQSYIADVTKIVPEALPYDLGAEQMAYGRSYAALDTIVQGAEKQATKEPLLFSKLSPELQEKVLGYVERVKGQMADTRYASIRYGEYKRDSGLLNYNRRTKFDARVGNVFPFAFWTTGSIAKWAIHSIDRPAMLTTYLRLKKFLETAGAPQEGFPSRFKDHLRVKLPFAPAWMGDQFIDPLRILLPFDAFAQPLEEMRRSQLSEDGRAQRLLQDKLEGGQITQRQYDDAVNMKAGNVWENALQEARSADEEGAFSAWDFATLMSSPHAPILWAYNLARGKPQDIGPFSPMSRTLRNAATIMGVDDYANSPWNVEGKIRKSLGLPAFDKWDDYRTDRALSDLAGEGKYTAEEISRAMIDRSGPVYEEGVKRANQEYTGGVFGALGAFLGIPVKSYPDGEANLRALQDDFSAAYVKYKEANDKLEAYMNTLPPGTDPDKALLDFKRRNPKLDTEALNNFFEAHPEYETRLALWKKPEERLHQFLIDQTWSRWNELPTVTKRELADQLGPQFNEAFLDKNTRSYDSISSGQMQVWLKLMGGKPAGTMSAEQEMLTDFFSGQLKLTKPETAWRAQVFYDTRAASFPDYYEHQNNYYQKGVKSEELKRYWAWRASFMRQNPDIVPYITDSQSAIDKAKRTRRNPEVAVPTAAEIRMNISPAMQNIIVSHNQTGDDLPYPAERQISILADLYGLSEEQIRGILGIQ